MVDTEEGEARTHSHANDDTDTNVRNHSDTGHITHFSNIINKINHDYEQNKDSSLKLY